MGANDPIYVANEPVSDLTVAAVTAAVGMTLGDRASGGILANPVLGAGFIGRAAFDKALGGSAIDIGWGTDRLAATAEGTDATILTLLSDTATVTPARYAIARQASDFARAMETMGVTDWVNFAVDATLTWQGSMLDLIMGLASTITATGGNAGGAASWGHVLEAAQLLGIANVAPPYVYVTRPKDWANVSTDAMTLGGRVQHQGETDAYLRSVDPGFKGIYLGGDLWVYTSSSPEVSGADNLSMMFGAQAIIWNATMPAPSPSTTPILWTPLYGCELDRDGLKNEDDIVYSSHIGASVRQNAAAVQLPFLT